MENMRKTKIVVIILNIIIITSIFIIYNSISNDFYKKSVNVHKQDVYNLSKTLKNNYFYNEGKTVTSLLGKLELTNINDISSKLNVINDVSGANLSYIMDRSGTVTASTLYKDNLNLIGKNYAFRPYFKNSIMGDNFIYTAIGVTTKKRGIYYSTPITMKGEKISGVLVLKKNFSEIDKLLNSYKDKLILVNPDGITFSSNVKEWILRKIENNQNLYDKFKYAEHTSFKPLPREVITKYSKLSFKEVIEEEISFKIIGETWKIISIRELSEYQPTSFTYLSIIIALIILIMFNIFTYFVMSINIKKGPKQ